MTGKCTCGVIAVYLPYNAIGISCDSYWFCQPFSSKSRLKDHFWQLVFYKCANLLFSHCWYFRPRRRQAAVARWAPTPPKSLWAGRAAMENRWLDYIYYCNGELVSKATHTHMHWHAHNRTTVRIMIITKITQTQAQARANFTLARRYISPANFPTVTSLIKGSIARNVQRC